MLKIIVIAVVVTAVIGAIAARGRSKLEVVESVDLSRYVGRWYEIARLPNRFEEQCVDSVTAIYSIRPDGKIDVVNRCRKSSGEYATAKGKAKIVDKEVLLVREL